MMKKICKIVKIISFISACAAFVAFVFDRINSLKTKKYEKHKTYGLYEEYIKRPLDVFLSTGALIVFSPILLVTAILVKFKIGSPVLFTQDRPGKINPLTNQAKIFKLYKFRTMTDEKDDNGQLLSDAERLTSFGKKLRSTSLDELPELINIIKGDMAVVGPRPLLVQYLDRYNNQQSRRHEVRPGFTGLAQVNGRNSISWDEKFIWDLKYVDKITFFGDCKIVMETIKTVLKKDGISSAGEATMSEFMGDGN